MMKRWLTELGKKNQQYHCISETYRCICTCMIYGKNGAQLDSLTQNQTKCFGSSFGYTAAKWLIVYILMLSEHYNISHIG